MHRRSASVAVLTAAVLMLLATSASEAFQPALTAHFWPSRRPGACATSLHDTGTTSLHMSGFGAPRTPKRASGKKAAKKKGGASKQPSAAVAAPSAMQQQVAAIDVKKVMEHMDDTQDPFWQLIEPLLLSEFPAQEVERVLGFIKHATGQKGLPADIVEDKWRPHEDIHAFMEGIPATPFRDTSAFPFVAELERRYDEIAAEFEALLESDRERFQSVTSMNYESGWKTLVLYFNGHRIDDFPYDRCPVTASILDTIPIAGRIAGFNRQAPNSGIPLHRCVGGWVTTCERDCQTDGVDRQTDRQGGCLTVTATSQRWQQHVAHMPDGHQGARGAQGVDPSGARNSKMEQWKMHDIRYHV